MILEEIEETLDFSAMSKDSHREEILTTADDTTKKVNTTKIVDMIETDNTTETDVMDTTNDTGETKTHKCAEDPNIEQEIGHLKAQKKRGKATNFGNNRKRRSVRWEKTMVGSKEDGCSSGSKKVCTKNTDLENPPPSPGAARQETEPLGLLKRCQTAFNWDDFFYSFILGFLPTAWDVFSDLGIALQLKEEVDVETAGLSYLFVCLPGITPLFNLFSSKLSKQQHRLRSQLYLVQLHCRSSHTLLLA